LVAFLSWRGGFGQPEPFDLKRLVSAMFSAIWVIAMPVLVVVGIYSGYFTPTEVASVVVAYGLVIAISVYRVITFKDVVDVCKSTIKLSCMLYLILIGASLFAFVMTAEGVPQSLVEMVLTFNLSPLEFLILLNFMLLILGCFLDGLSKLVITLPLIYPISQSLGINPLHLAVLMTVNIELGVLLPPVGINLFVLSGISGLKIEAIVKALVPFYLFLIVALVMMTYFPDLSTWLPTAMSHSL